AEHRVPNQPDGRAAEDEKHLEARGHPQHHLDPEKAAAGDGIRQEFFQIQRSAQAGHQNRRELPVDDDENQNSGKQRIDIAADLRIGGECSHSDGRNAPESIPKRRGHEGEKRAAPSRSESQDADAFPLGPEYGPDYSHSSLANAFSAPTTRTKTSSRVSDPARRSSSAPSVTILPSWMMATR